MSGLELLADGGGSGAGLDAVWQVALILFFVLLNGFFVAAEFAIVKVRVSQLDELVRQGNKTARAARHVVSHLDSYLSATQLGITIASIGLGMLGERYVEGFVHTFLDFTGVRMGPEMITAISLALAFTIITFLHIVLGELMPKSLAIRKALPTTLLISRPLEIFHGVFRPAIWLLNGTANTILKLAFRIDPVSDVELVHSEDELRLLVTESERSENVTEMERDIFINALELNDRLARDVMTPRSEVVSLEPSDGFHENLKVALESKHTRFPLVDGHLDTPLGIVHVKDLLRIVNEPEPDLTKIVHDAIRVPELIPLDKLLRVFLKKHAHMALVSDEFGGTLGIVTLDNVIEELVGDIQDEFDTTEKEIHELRSGEFLVDGTLPLYELADYAGLKLENPDVSTIGGYVTGLLGHLPANGEMVTIEDYEVTASKTDGRRIVQLHFRKTSPSPEPGLHSEIA